MIGTNVLDLFKIIGDGILSIMNDLGLDGGTVATFAGLGIGMVITMELGVATGILINKCCKPANEELKTDPMQQTPIRFEIYEDGESPDGYDSDPITDNLIDVYNQLKHESLENNSFRI